MNLDIFSPRLRLILDFLSFFMVAPELIGENLLRKTRKNLVIFFFWANILLLLLTWLSFIYILVFLPFWLGNTAILVTGSFVSFRSGENILFDPKIAAYVLSPLILFIVSFIPPLVTKALSTLIDQETTRRLLIKIGVGLFVISKIIEFLLSKTG